MKTGDRFRNVKTGAVIEVVEELPNLKVRVGTVAGDRLANIRTMSGTQLHLTERNRMGQKWQSGYVKMKAPAAPQAPSGEPDLAALETSELVRWLDRVNAQKAILEKLAENAKDELRRRDLTEGVSIFGETAVVYAVPQMFDGKKAKALLTPQQYEAICVTKPDSKKAQAMLGKDSSEYQELCSPGTARITVRQATEEDLENVELKELAA
jgi:hypothetical protein